MDVEPVRMRVTTATSGVTRARSGRGAAPAAPT